MPMRHLFGDGFFGSSGSVPRKTNYETGLPGHHTFYGDNLVDDPLSLAGSAVEERISSTVRDLAELIRPRIVAPGHCTGWRANAALAEEFAPNAFAPSVVGAR